MGYIYIPDRDGASRNDGKLDVCDLHFEGFRL